MKKISIITVSYNAASTIEATILSVIKQTYPLIEYIIIDGKSTDRTLDIIKKYNKNISFWISEKDGGIYDAMNKGLKIATGDYLLFLGADDRLFSEQTIESIISKLQEEEVYYGDCYMTTIRKVYWGKFNRYKLAIGNICHQSIFYPKKIYKNYIYDTSFKIYADYVYNLKIYNKIKFNYLDETISLFNYNGISSSSKDTKFKKKEYILVLQNLGIVPVIIRLSYKLILSLLKRR